MSQSLVRQMYGLLWKNLLIKKRHYISTSLELLIPLALCLLISWSYSKVPRVEGDAGKHIPPTVSDEIDFNSSSYRVAFSDDAKLCFSPDTEEALTIMRNVQEQLKRKYSVEKPLDPHKDESEVDKAMDRANATFTAPFNCIVFDDLSALKRENGSFKYKVKSYLAVYNLWVTKASPGPETAPPSDKVHQYQYWLNQALLTERKNLFTQLTFTEVKEITTQRIPYPSYVTTNSDFASQLLPGFLVYSFIVIFPFAVNRVCSEKASMSREMLKMNGLSNAAYWTSNIGFIFVSFALVSIIVVASMKIPIFSHAPWGNSNFFLLLACLLVHSLLLILSGMICSVIFGQKPKVCTTVAVIFFITTISLNSHFENRFTGFIAPLSRMKWFCAIPNMAMLLLLRIIAKFEGETTGITWNTVSVPVDELNGLTYLNVMGSMSLSILVQIVLLWYLDSVWPWQPGVAQPFYFLFTKSYWFPSSPMSGRDRSIQLGARSREKHATNHGYFEEDPSKDIAIECRGLRKEFSGIFKSETKVAVDGLDLRIHLGEITCLLGHNGAGKTTTMNMITGMFTPTSGSIIVNGFNLLTQTSRARSSMSLCPQHNPLYEELTVRQHLYLYACIKGYPLSQVNDEINLSLQLTGMLEHADKRPDELSGGMKRKLCLGIALVGGSQILILDEPSSGLDTEARRFMWDTLKRIRQTRTILLTTHDMEEADALADRIIIMHEGQAVCAGTSMFLKHKLGTGYSLAISKGTNFDAKGVLRLVHKYLPRASVKMDIGSEITYELREDESSKKNLSKFFRDLETHSSELGIHAFGASVSTLEDVFLKIGEVSAGPSKESERESERRHPSEASLLVDRLDGSHQSGSTLFISQFIGLFLKRVHHAKRSWKTLTYQIILPCVIFFLAFRLSDTVTTAVNLLTKPYEISLNLYPETGVVIQTDGSAVADRFKDNLKVIVEGTRHKLQEVDADANMTQYFLSAMQGKFNSLYLKTHVVGFTVREEDRQYKIIAWVNLDATASFKVAIDLIQKTQSLEQIRSIDPTTCSGRIYASSQAAYDKQIVSSLLNVFGGVSWMIFIPLSVTFLASSYIVFPTLEKTSKAKLIQLMSGLNPIVLHLGSLAFDLLSHLLTSILLITFIALIDTDDYFLRNASDFVALLCLLITFGAASMVIGYFLSYFFSSDARAFVMLNIINVITGIVMSITMYILKFLRTIGSVEDVTIISKSVYDTVFALSSISPVFSITSALTKMYDNNYSADICASLPPDQLDCERIMTFVDRKLACCPDICRNDTLGYDVCVYQSPFGWTGNRVLSEITSMIVVFVFFSLLIVVYEFFGSAIVRLLNSLKSIPPPQFSDSDVIEEHNKVQRSLNDGTYTEEALTVFHLYKRFKSFFAVRGVSFFVHKHECFGLLGVNGAGKSTTFGMLTGDLTPARGIVFQEGISLEDNKRLYQQNLGYCPQFNPIIDNMTGLEMIYLFGRLRGFGGDLLRLLADEMVALVDLQDHAARPSGKYSGGNKRKLSIALAMIGNPKIVLLDEPTAGVDPAARRKIWTSLSHIREQLNCSMILTSHSMHECEALCSRMAIMVQGEFVCLGSPQHLKSKFGQGYTLTIKVKRVNASNPEYMASFTNVVAGAITDFTLVDQNDSILVYRIARSAGTLSHLFDQMERLKQLLDLEDYTLSDTTLEQVFIQFAKQSHSSTQ